MPAEQARRSPATRSEMPKNKSTFSFKAIRKFLVRRRPRPAPSAGSKRPKKLKQPKGKKTEKGKKSGKFRRPGVPALEAAASVLSTPLQVTLRAASFAARKHMGQKRADGITPYFSHVARVAFVLSHVFGIRDEPLIAAAFLHDTLEDTATDYDELEEEFGQDVADIVVLLTKNNMLPKQLREREYETRLTSAPERVKIAKMADIYDNLSDRVTSIKILKTTQTAERLLQAFAPLLTSPTGHAAHARTLRLLEEIHALQLDTLQGPRMGL